MIKSNTESGKFTPPEFSTGEVEFRVENNEVCLYATEVGLKEIISLCQALVNKKDGEHLHLEDYNILTKESMNSVIAKFAKEK